MLGRYLRKMSIGVSMLHFLPTMGEAMNMEGERRLPHPLRPKPILFQFEPDENDAPLLSAQRRHQFTRLQTAYEEDLVQRENREPTTPRERESSLVIGAFSGGGVRGLLQASTLRAISEEADVKLSEMFDAVGGTSVGGILSGAISTGRFEANQCVGLLKDNASKIFYKSWINTAVSINGFSSAKYSRQPLDSILEQQFGRMYLSQTAIPFCAPGVLREWVEEKWVGPGFMKEWMEENWLGFWSSSKYHVFKSVEARLNPLENDLMLKDVLAVTSAAPSYYAPHEFDFKGLRYRGMDGGLVANSPDLETILHAQDHYGKLGGEDVVLLFRTGRYKPGYEKKPGYVTRVLQRVSPFRNGGIYELAGSVFEAFMEGQSQRSQKNAKEVMQKLGIQASNIYEFNGDLTDLTMDRTDDGFLEELEEAGPASIEQMAQEERDQLMEVFRRRAERRN